MAEKKHGQGVRTGDVLFGGACKSDEHRVLQLTDELYKKFIAGET